MSVLYPVDLGQCVQPGTVAVTADVGGQGPGADEGVQGTGVIHPPT